MFDDDRRRFVVVVRLPFQVHLPQGVGGALPLSVDALDAGGPFPQASAAAGGDAGQIQQRVRALDDFPTFFRVLFAQTGKTNALSLFSES